MKLVSSDDRRFPCSPRTVGGERVSCTTRRINLTFGDEEALMAAIGDDEWPVMRKCPTCKTAWIIRAVESEGATKAVGYPVYRLEWRRRDEAA